MEDLAYLLELVEAIKLDIILSEDEHKLIERNVVFFNGVDYILEKGLECVFVCIRPGFTQMIAL